MMNFEPEDEEALNLLIPKYITSLIYGGMIEAIASENGARMQAMDAATSNAEEMIEDLTLALQSCPSGLHYAGTDRNYRRRKRDLINKDKIEKG